MDVKEITREELIKLQNSGKPFKLIDVLEKDSFAMRHIPGAISMPILELRTEINKLMANNLLSKDEVIVTYCGSFSCPLSTKAAKILMSEGFTQVFDYKGGIQDYKEGGFPLERNFPPKITLNSKSLTLVGRKLKIGQLAPQFNVVDSNLAKINLDDFPGKIKVITSFVSVDTPVCDLQVKSFNKNATKLAENVVVLGISKDLPFAQKRFCSANDIKNVTILSDYKNSSFGINYGLLIKENNLLARATIILDADDIVRFIDVVPEVTSEPNYELVLKNLEKIIAVPRLPYQEQKLAQEKCVPCEEGTPHLEQKVIDSMMSTVNGWQLVENKKLVREFVFKDFVEAKYFFDLLAVIAEEQRHHPNFTLIYNKLKVTLTTHASGGLTPNDFVMAKIIGEVYE